MANLVIVENKSSSRVGINNPDLRFRRVWDKKGAKVPVDIDLLREALYDSGVQYLFEQGILYIEDMKAKIELGLEAEGTTIPTNIIALTDDEKKRMLGLMPIYDFKKKLEALPYEQYNALVEYAITNNIVNIEKAEILKKLTNIDIIKAIELKRSAEI